MIMNRHARRVAAKAIRCLKRGTKVPGGILAQTYRPGLDAVAARMGRKIGENGKVEVLA